ncbi:hypothetical protein ACEPPN_018121 [Leptodophora sp. 'Broadleaf-Isolate-01']
MTACATPDFRVLDSQKVNYTDRIAHWIKTGDHVFDAGCVEVKVTGSTIVTEFQHHLAGRSTSISQHTTTTCQNPSSIRSDGPHEDTDRNSVELLVGFKNDPLIPSTEQIYNTFLRAQKSWQEYVARANSLPPSCVAATVINPDILLQQMPPLPRNLPNKRSITGEAVWCVPKPELPRSSDAECWNPDHVHGVKKTFLLSVSKPTEFRISNQSSFRPNDTQPNGIAILVPLWSYIFTVRFLEMQGRSICYSNNWLNPILLRSYQPQSGDIVVHLGPAPRDLVRWFCAVLAPGLGWSSKGRLPPWAAHYHNETRFVITVDVPFVFLDDETPPSSHSAANILIEFCTLFDFESPVDKENSCLAFQQVTVAFLAALALPFYKDLDLKPQLPLPRITINHKTSSRPLHFVRDYVNDLPYYMTLSIHPGSIGSVIWSIFWEPGITCNIVSAWFGAILEVLRPTIEVGDLEMLAKIFIARRMRPALLWLGVLVMGDTAILNLLVTYLETHQELENFGSWSGPDVDVTTWTGSKQSFLDEDLVGTYEGLSAQVPRSDLLRHRFNFRFGDFGMPRFGWEPVGHVSKQDIEPELWPQLEAGCSREYKYWIWWLPHKGGRGLQKITEPHIERGFLRDISQQRRSFPDETNQESGSIAIPDGFTCKVKLALSKLATFHIVSFGSMDASGDENLGAMVIPNVRNHPWMADSRRI